MPRLRLSRRELLQHFGLAAASLPFLDALGNVARAAPAAPSKRLVCIVLEHGLFAQHGLPYVPSTLPVGTTSPGSLLKAPRDYLQKVAFEQRAGCTAIDLSPYGGALGPIHSAKWQGLKQKTAFLKNLGCSNVSVQGHTATAALGGYKNVDLPTGPVLTGETLDVIIGRKLNGRLPLTLKTPDWIDDIKFLEEAGGPTVYQDANGFSTKTFLRDPVKTWDLLFSSYVPPTTGPKLRDPTARRLALLDRTLQNVAKVEKDSRLSAFDRQRLDNHASLLAAQRTTLATMTTPPAAAAATPPPRPKVVAQTTDAFNLAKGTLFKAQFANAAAALKMNKEQVITINTGLENEWLTDGLNLGGSQAYHGNAGHLSNPSDAIIESCRQVQQYVLDAIADFLTELDTVEDPASGATYLDNTLVMIVTEHDGRPNGHLRESLPVILAGGFGTFQGGKLYDFSIPAKWQPDASAIYTGFSYSRLLLTVLGAFGVQASERASMDLQGVKQDWGGSDLTDWNLPLPGLV